MVNREILRLRLMAATALAVLCCASAVASGQKRPDLAQWEKATRAREALESIPAAKRTRADYSRALDSYRAVYHESPQSAYAPDAVYAVAELLAEQGRTLRDRRSLKAAVGQYEFLRQQYPGSSLRVPALLAEAQINQNDLHDAATARELYSLFLRQYPRSPSAEEAQAGLNSLQAEASRRDAPPARASVTKGTGEPANAQAAPHRSETAPPAAAEETPTVLHVAHPSRAGTAQVTGIRHWSTPSYTRVAIDLGDDVTYEAARVPNPDRIYFDLHGTHLARDLNGHSFEVTDDGFLKRIRAAQYSDNVTRIVLDVNDVTEYSAFLLPNPYRLIIDIHGRPAAQTAAKTQSAETAPGAGKSGEDHPVPNTVVTKNPDTASEVAAISEQPGRVDATRTPTSRPIAAIVKDNSGASAAETAGAARRTKTAQPARAAAPTADGETSLVRALGLKINRIVIDAGHGGHDSGTIGVDGLEEKDLVLDVALRLGKLLHDRLGAEVIYTRSDDTFIPLETRTAIANKAQADLFLSIHANSSPDSEARGVETYYLNFTTQQDALEVAARENALSTQSIHQLSDLVKKIALKEKIEESREFAGDVQSSLYAGLEKGNGGLRNRGVKRAPFVVLIGANMPSILAEISFITNPRDAGELRRPSYRQRVAESLYNGVARYAGGLGGGKASIQSARN